MGRLFVFFKFPGKIGRKKEISYKKMTKKGKMFIRQRFQKTHTNKRRKSQQKEKLLQTLINQTKKQQDKKSV